VTRKARRPADVNSWVRGRAWKEAALLADVARAVCKKIPYPSRGGGPLTVWLLCFALFALPAHAEPSRIISLDYCADQYVLALADREQIAALSRGSQRDDSYYRARARGIRQTRGSLEEVLALRPDLVVRTWGGPYDAQTVYARFGIPVHQIGDATSFEAARAELVSAGAAFRHAERADALARDLDMRLEDLHRHFGDERPAVMYISAAGAVAGSGTMMDAIIEAAGGRNTRADANWSVVSMEEMVQAPPALLALGFFDHGRERMNAWSRTRHSAVRRALRQSRTVSLPTAAIACEAWYAIDAAEAIAAALHTT
jgi:iron complex transport system substrate-binding protein